MEVYKASIEFAITFFPFVAFLLTVPFLLYQYRKYGAIPLLRGIIFYSLILYLITAYFLVILPLPSFDTVKELQTPIVQLIPFNFINDISLKKFNISSPIDIINILKSPVVYTVLFNICLTLPFGVYLKYYFNKKWYQTIMYTFALSLFFELTQVTGLYGIYPRAYRLFDVDDLIINTLGGLIGHSITPILMIFLPSREQLDKESYRKGKRVTLLRRIIVFLIDLIFLAILSLILKIISYNTPIQNHTSLVTLIIYYLILPLITKGKTIGKMALNLKITSMSEKTYWFQILIRNFLLSFLTLYPSVLLSYINSYTKNQIIMNRIKIIIIIYQIVNIIYYIITLSKENHQFLYEKITNTKNISTIEYIDKEDNNIGELEE